MGLAALRYRACYFSDMGLGMGTVPDLECPPGFALDEQMSASILVSVSDGL